MNVKNTIVNRILLIRQSSGISRFLIPGLLLFLSCAPGSESPGLSFSADLLPPQLQTATPEGKSIQFVFDEPIGPALPEVSIEPDLTIEELSVDGKTLTLYLGSEQLIGEPYTARVTVSDSSRNSLTFLYRFYGWNPRIPRILINEINPRGSGKTPDCIELYTVKGGNLGGLTLKVGTENRYSQKFIFPAIEVADGSYILIHTKKEGLPEEINEIGEIDESGGLLASDNARDFWLPEAKGLPGNNGAVTLFSQNGGDVIDAVLWSNRSDDMEDDKLGWTSEGFIFAEDMATAEAWHSENSHIPLPSDAVDVSVSTATRSLCRASSPEDTDSAADWHTVPTRGATFGTVNTDEEY